MSGTQVEAVIQAMDLASHNGPDIQPLRLRHRWNMTLLLFKNFVVFETRARVNRPR